MAETTFEVKSYPEMWRSLGVDVERFEKMRCVIGDVYQKNFMFQHNRPQAMEYFDWIISEIHGGRIAEILEAKRQGSFVVGTFCVYIPEEVVLAAGGICIGTRYFKDLIDEGEATLDGMLEKLTDRYMKIDCSCFTPNDERPAQVVKECRESNAQGVIHYSLQFCHTYNIEAIKVREACEKAGIPFIAIESDYSPEDIGQIQTRVEAFLEQIRARG